MSKKNKPAAATGPTAPENSDAAAPAEAPKKTPTLAERVRTLEVKAFGHAPHDEPAE